MLTDRELWDGLCQGNVESFEGFYRSQVGRLRSFLRLYVGNAQAAEDVAHEAFMQLWKHPNGFNPARSTLKSYLFGIARKRAAERRLAEDLRTLDRERERRLNEIQKAHDEDVDELTTACRRRLEEIEGGYGRAWQMMVEDALAQLEPELRSLLWLREVEGYSYAELAEILGTPIGTVKSRLFAARERLRKVWKGNATQF